MPSRPGELGPGHLKLPDICLRLSSKTSALSHLYQQLYKTKIIDLFFKNLFEFGNLRLGVTTIIAEEIAHSNENENFSTRSLGILIVLCCAHVQLVILQLEIIYHHNLEKLILR